MSVLELVWCQCFFAALHHHRMKDDIKRGPLLNHYSRVDPLVLDPHSLSNTCTPFISYVSTVSVLRLPLSNMSASSTAMRKLVDKHPVQRLRSPSRGLSALVHVWRYSSLWNAVVQAENYSFWVSPALCPRSNSELPVPCISLTEGT